MKKFVCVCLSLLFVLGTFASCGEKAVDVPYGLKLASDTSVVDYYLFVPDDWNVDISTGVTTAYYSSNDSTSITASVYGLSDSVTDSITYWKFYTKQFSDVFGDPQNVESSNLLLDGKEAMQFVYTAAFGENEYKFWQVVCTRNNFAYIITYASTAENYDKHTDDMQAVIEGFKFMV